MKYLSQIVNPAIPSRVGDLTAFTGTGGTVVIQAYIINFIKIAYVIGSVASFGMLLWGTIEYISSGGEKEKTGNASKRMTNSLIGIVMLLSAYAVFKLIDLIFGINLLKLDVPAI